MTGTAYKRSAELAGVVGPYEGFARNAEAHARVMRKHAAANDAVRTLTSLDKDVHRAATKAWADGNKIGEKNGWRNAQASVLAPTGTIGFMMDCDTTGIEPDFSLVKFKKLVGGGSMQIVNQTIPRALRKLGYAEETVEAIVEYIAEHGPRHRRSRPAHRALRRLRLRDGRAGDRADGPRADDGGGAAVPVRRDLQDGQPAGDGDRRGDRGRLLRRAGSSASRRSRSTATTARSASRSPTPRPRPRRLERSRPAATDGRRVPPDPQAAAEVAPVADHVVHRRRRRGLHDRRLLRRRPLGEVFLKLGKQGSTLAGVMDAFSIAISIGLQYGVPLETYVSKFVNMRFDPAGLTDDPDIRMAQSIMDYIFRRLALDYLSFDERSALGIYTADGAGPPARHRLVRGAVDADERRGRARDAGADAGASRRRTGRGAGGSRSRSRHRRPGRSSRRPPRRRACTPRPSCWRSSPGTAADAPLCITCGIKMRPAGSCYVCEGCGSTSGCS